MPLKNKNNQAKRKPRAKARIPRRRKANPGRNAMAPMMRRKTREPRTQDTMCRMSATERVTQVIVPASVTPGTLLFSSPVNPTSSPRLAAVATQFDSWYGTITMEVETTGNAFSQDYAILRHVPNGDPSRLPTNARNLLNLAETCEKRSESAKLQLDSNKTAQVVATWKTSYNPRKPILDSDPSECNNGLFILVADGSPGTTPVNLTIRFRYNIVFYGPQATPIVINPANTIVGAPGVLTPASIFGTAPAITGPGSNFAAGNIIDIASGAPVSIAVNVNGTGLTVPTFSILNGIITTVISTPKINTAATAASYVIIVKPAEDCTLTTTITATAVTASQAFISPFVLTY